MHPQAPNTQTFLHAFLLPSAWDYNGLGCFDPLERKFDILEAAISLTFVRLGQRRGLQLISELTDDVIAALFPSEREL